MALNYSYDIVTESYSVSLNSCFDGDLQIPESYDNGIDGLKPVISIHEKAFENCLGITSINIPNSIEYIGRYAFQNCTALTNVNILNKSIVIGQGAFSNCINLASIHFKSKPSVFGANALDNTSPNLKLYY